MHRTLREMRKQLSQAADWRTELDRMKTGGVVGCLHVETKTMRTELLQVPTAIMQQVCSSLQLRSGCCNAWQAVHRLGCQRASVHLAACLQPACLIITAHDLPG